MYYNIRTAETMGLFKFCHGWLWRQWSQRRWKAFALLEQRKQKSLLHFPSEPWTQRPPLPKCSLRLLSAVQLSGKAHKDSDHTIVITVVYWHWSWWWSCKCYDTFLSSLWHLLLTSTACGGPGIPRASWLSTIVTPRWCKKLKTL